MTDAHLAACAAQTQQKFHEFMEAFWEQGFNAYRKSRDAKMLGEENILKIAGELGLNVAKLKTDMRGEACKKRVADDMAELSKFKVSGTPSFFVNGKNTGFAGPEAFTKLIEDELAEVEKSGVAPAEYYEKVVMAGEKQFKSRASTKAEKN